MLRNEISAITISQPITTPPANAQAPGGTVTKVEFFANGQSIGSSTTAPYSITIPNVPESGYVLVARVTDARGVTISSAPVKVLVGNPKKVYFVTADPGPLSFAGDQAVYDHLLQRGFNVILARGSDVPDDGATAQGMDLIVESSSLGSGTVEVADANGLGVGKFKNLAIPAINWEASSADAFGFKEANPVAGTSTQTELKIVDATHPLAAGLPAGNVTVVTSSQTFSQADDPVGAHIIAENVADPAQKHIFYYEKGDKGFADFVMPERRVFFFFQDNTASAANDAGWKLFDAAVDWSLRRTTTTNPPPGNVSATITRTQTGVTVGSTGGGTVEATTSLAAPINWQGIGTAPVNVPADLKARFFRIRK